MKTQILKTICISLLLVIPTLLSAQVSYGEIRGIIKNTDLEVVPFATVKILRGNELVGGTQSDANGKYKYKPLVPGNYEMVVMEAGHATQPIKNVLVEGGEATYVDVKLSVNTLTTITVVAKAIEYAPPGVDARMYVMESISGDDLRRSAGFVSGNMNSAILTITSDVVESADGDLHFRGGRAGASASYVDGVRTFGETMIPGSAIENLTVFTGGVPACYGDMTSGMVMITTKSYFSGIREKNIRNAKYQEKKEEDKRLQKAKEDEEHRLKEIEAEKKKEAEEKQNTDKKSGDNN
jgi:hypothetical protein